MPTVDLEIYDAANKFIDNAVKEKKPFFVWFNTTRMHVWTHLKPSAQGRTGIGLYPDGMVEHDDMVGGLLKQLDDLGIADNTIVVYGTDNGAETGTWPDGGTTPFHGEKGTTWEGGFRVPMLVRWPGVIKPGTIINEIFSQEDWLPTLLAAAGEPDIVEKLKKGYEANGKTWKVHARRLQLPAVLQGRGEEGPARGNLLLRPGRRPECHSLERLEGSFAVTNGNIATAMRDVPGWPEIVNLRADPYEKAPRESGMYHSLVCRQHLALRAGAAEAQGVSHDAAGISVPAGQQPERGGHQLQLAPGDAGHEAPEGIGDPLGAGN